MMTNSPGLYTEGTSWLVLASGTFGGEIDIDTSNIQDN